MNAEITILQTRIIGLYEAQLPYLRGKPLPFINDLQHECQEIIKVPSRHDFSVVMAAQINLGCCYIILNQPAA